MIHEMLALDLEQLSTARATCTHQGLPDCRRRREGNQIARSLAVRQDEAFTNSVFMHQLLRNPKFYSSSGPLCRD